MSTLEALIIASLFVLGMEAVFLLAMLFVAALVYATKGIVEYAGVRVTFSVTSFLTPYIIAFLITEKSQREETPSATESESLPEARVVRWR